MSQPMRASTRATRAFAAQLGVGVVIRIGRQSWVSMRIVNPLGVSLAHNAAAEAHTNNDVNNLRYFDPSVDSLVFGANSYRELRFVPKSVQHMDGFKFVYLSP
jgi:hypothetical protein